MKTIFYFAVLLGLLLYPSSCSKKNSNSTQNPTNNPYKVEVYEYKSNLPVQGASVKLNRCTKYDFEFGCQAIGTFSNYTTDAEGIAMLRDADYAKCDEGIVIEKSGYWSMPGGVGRNLINPEGFVQATVKKVNDYSMNNHFFILDSNENYQGASGPWRKVVDIFPINDTTIQFKAFGGQINHLKWIVGTEYLVITGWSSGYMDYSIVAQGILDPLTVNKNGIAAIHIEY
jgi:hypothetical protein